MYYDLTALAFCKPVLKGVRDQLSQNQATGNKRIKFKRNHDINSMPDVLPVGIECLSNAVEQPCHVGPHINTTEVAGLVKLLMNQGH